MKEAIILAGGLGTRLQSVVKDIPKCMAEVAGKPFLWYVFRYLHIQGIEHIILSLGYRSQVVTDWLSHNVFPFTISYVIEKEPLGTGGAIKFAFSKTKTGQAYVVNGDTFFNVDLAKFSDFHLKNQADISLALKPMKDFDRYGSVETDKDGQILQFNEKQFCEKGLINGGIYLINKSVFEKLSFPQKFSFEKDVLEAENTGLKLMGCKSDTYFIDIGIPEDYEKANIDFLNFGK